MVAYAGIAKQLLTDPKWQAILYYLPGIFYGISLYLGAMSLLTTL